MISRFTGPIFTKFSPQGRYLIAHYDFTLFSDRKRYPVVKKFRKESDTMKWNCRRPSNIRCVEPLNNHRNSL